VKTRPPSLRPSRGKFLKTRDGKLLLGLGAVFLCMACLTVLTGLALLFQTQLLDVFRTPTAEPTQPLELLLPQQDCPPMGLALGGRTFSVERVDLAPDGGLPTPPEAADKAFWVNGTGENRVLLLGMNAFGADAAALSAGQEATLTMGNCNLSKYRLSAALPASYRDAGLFDPSLTGLTVFIQTSPDGAGFVFHGEVIEEQISRPSSIETNSAEVQAEIGILQVLPSADGGAVLVKLSLYNYGGAAITLTQAEVALLAEGASPQPPAAAQPPLPLEIQAGETVEISLVFARPATGWGILKVFTVEYNLADFVE